MGKSNLRLRYLLQLSFVSVIALVTLITINGQAHAGVYGWKWGITTVNYDPHTMSSGWIQIASDGRQPWNNVTPSPFTMLRNDSSANDVYLQAIDGDGGYLALTYLYCGANICSQVGSTVTRALIRFDTIGTWHLDSNCMVPTNAFDARGAAAHEFGHFATLSHSSFGCGGSNPATMCATIPRGVLSCEYRSLTSDDQGYLNTQYP
jgi:hypothetical protein